MKHGMYWWLLGAGGIIFLEACSGGKKESADAKSPVVMAVMEQTQASRLQQMKPTRHEDKVVFRGREYVSVVTSSPDESLQTVKSETGDCYVDNVIQVCLTCGDKTVFSHNFSKKDFSALADEEFLKKAVLEGIAFDSVTDDGFQYAASMAYPDTDLYMPVQIRIFPDGRFQIGLQESL